MKGCTLLLVALILAVIKNGASLDVVYMDTIKNSINVDCLGYGTSSSGILKSNNVFSYRSNWDRTLILTTTSNCGIVVAIREIDFRPNYVDNLTLSDVNSLKPIAVFFNQYYYRNRNYDPFERKSYIFPEGQVKVRFMTGPYPSTGYNGFELIFTAYKKSIFCSRKEFKCLIGCISSSLECDGHNHCGDRAEQVNCNFPVKRNIAAIVCGVVFLLIAVACVIFIVIRRASRSETERTTVINHPPPAYPPPGTYYPPPPPAYTQYSQGQTNPGFR